MRLTPYQLNIFYEVQRYFSAEVELALKKLLEEKHLYQSTKVMLLSIVNFPWDYQDWEPEYWPTDRDFHPDDPQFWKEIEVVENAIYRMKWQIVNSQQMTGRIIPLVNQPLVEVNLPVSPPPVQLFCEDCKAKRAYRFLFGYDVFDEVTSEHFWGKEDTEQVFALVYQCQTCKGLPEVFLVHRHKAILDPIEFVPAKLTLTGRMPMEKPVIPRSLPKKEQRYFRSALIAFNSGQALAAKFLLRIFLEQYVRGISSNPKARNIESLFDEYNAMLPDDFKQRFPSLKAIYDQLSEDIHAADELPESFELARSQVEEHFDAKRLFKIPNYPKKT